MGTFCFSDQDWTVDDLGNVLTLRDSINNTTTWAYDYLGRTASETNAFGSRTYQYDDDNNLVKAVDREAHKGSAQRGHSTLFHCCPVKVLDF